jgi:hypothetical protein
MSPASAIPPPAKESAIVALTGTESTVSAAPVPTSGHQTREAVAVRAPEPASAAVPDVPKASAPSTSGPLGFTLHFDADMQRLILEVREPSTGFVILQIPAKYVIKQFSAGSDAAPSTRGARVNSAV